MLEEIERRRMRSVGPWEGLEPVARQEHCSAQRFISCFQLDRGLRVSLPATREDAADICRFLGATSPHFPQCEVHSARRTFASTLRRSRAP